MDENQNRKFHISMRTFIIVTVLAVAFLAIAGISIGVMIFVNKSSEETLLAQTEQQAGKLADQVALHHFRIQSSENTLDANINESAFLAGGRILIIDQNYRIQKDTFSFQQDAYIISEDVMSVMSGEVDKISRIRNKYAKVILPIKDEGDSIIGVIVATASTNAIDQTYHSMLKSTIQLGLIIVPLVFIAVLIVSWLTVRGLREMNRKIAYISEGNLEAQLPVKGFRETRYLARNYNSVISKLADIDTTRQEFVSDVSHELKTPITSMKVLAESLLQNENADTAAYREFMTDIVDEIDRETKIINDLLALVKTDKQNAVMNFAEVNINELIDVIMRRVAPIAKARNIELTYESYREVKAEVDEVKLSLVISNLVENAVKYNVDNGWVRITLNADHSFFYIKVADSGVGIPEDAKDKVFERFYRVGKDRSRDTGGTGLGLAIARAAINAHGGTIKLYSESGKGTTFTVRLPLFQDHSNEQETVTDEIISSGKVEAVKVSEGGESGAKKN